MFRARLCRPVSEDDSVRLVVAPELEGERADLALARLAGLPRSVVRRLFDEQHVHMNEEPIAARRRVTAGDVIVYQPVGPRVSLQAMDVEFSVVHEDADVIVVDKPAGLTVHPGGSSQRPTLAAGLLHRYPEIEGVGVADRWGIVHRLDRDTSGLLIVARTRPAYMALADALRERRVLREYLVLCDGLFQTPLGTIDAPIGTDPSRATRRVVRVDGRPARTHYERIDEWADSDATLVRVRLETGRTHQIRVHLSSIDHPVIGDRWYGRPHRLQPPRLFLHAARLAFDHPITGDMLDIESPLPPDLLGSLPSSRDEE